MKVLVACEFSGVVRDAFRNRGHDAYSCDIVDSERESSYHIKDDVIKHLNDGWDLIIAHPPCTYLCVSGARWFKPEYRTKYPTREQDRDNAVDFFLKIYNCDVDKIAVENPVGSMSTRFRKPDQIIQPYQFGDTTSKKTCLWLKNLPKLIPTKIVEPEYVIMKNGERTSKFHHDSFNLPKEQRSSFRSRTFSGIANAMAEQWG